MNTENITVNNPLGLPDGYISSSKLIMPGEVEGITIEHVSLKGSTQFQGLPHPNKYDVILSLKGKGSVETGEGNYRIRGNSVARMPYNKKYSIYVKQGEEIHFLQFRKMLDDADRRVISQNMQRHSEIYVKTLNECPVYTEDIKSGKTVNRMLLPEGMVPRFCMGSVESKGPDSVGEHSHPMLDQLFFGMKGCKCSCAADGDKAVLTENMMLHIPLGSNHSVFVEEGDTLSYIWLDFFLSLEGQKYMSEQHQMDDENER